MAIINFTFDLKSVPQNAERVHVTLQPQPRFYASFDRSHPDYEKELHGPYILITWETFIGCCLVDREINGYHDSDFTMLVWDDRQQQPRTITFASTRGWSYPSYGSYVDATPEVWAKYNAFVEARKEEAERIKAAQAAELKAVRLTLCADYGKRDGFDGDRLASLIDKPYFGAILALFGPRIRSTFKLSLRAQIIKWCQNDNPQYADPLSKRQLSFIMEEFQ